MQDSSGLIPRVRQHLAALLAAADVRDIITGSVYDDGDLRSDLLEASQLSVSVMKQHGYYQEKRIPRRGQGWRQSSSGQDPRVGSPHTVII